MSEVPADWFLLLLRVLFIVLLYLFLYQLFRVQLRQLMAVATRPEARPSEPAQTRASLIVIPGNGETPPVGTRFVLSPMTTVGRHADNVIQLDEPSISAQHAELRLTRKGWWVTDLGSTNGTFLNGERIHAPTGMSEGDVVQFGRVRMQLERG